MEHWFVPLSVCVAKNRSISLPLELEGHINNMLSISALGTHSRTSQTFKPSNRTTRITAPSNPWDYKNIIEKLQVLTGRVRGESTIGVPLHYLGSTQTLNHNVKHLCHWWKMIWLKNSKSSDTHKLYQMLTEHWNFINRLKSFIVSVETI